MGQDFRFVAALEFAIRDCVANASELATRSLGPFAASVLLTAIYQHVFAADLYQSASAQISAVVITLPLAFFALSCHRIAVRNRRLSVSDHSGSNAHLFILWSTASVALTTITALFDPTSNDDVSFFTLFLVGVTFMANLGALVVVVRCSLVLPALVAGEPSSLSLAWYRTRGYGWRLFWASSISPLILVIPAYILLRSTVEYPLPLDTTVPVLSLDRLAAIVVFEVVWFVAAAIGAFVLCHAYEVLRPRQSAA